MVLVAKDIVESEFIALPKDTSALEAAKQMKAKRHGYVIITAPSGDPEGIVTEWDYLAKIVAEGIDPARIRLSDIMSSDLVSVHADVGLDEVSQIMTRKGIRRVLVVKDHKVPGVITARTMLARMKEYVDRVSTQIARLQAPMF